MQLNRVVAFVLSYFWKKVAQDCKYVQIDRRLATEMVMALCVLPLMYCDLRLRTEAYVSATDASGHAGGISRSVSLAKRGEEAVVRSGRRGYQTCSDECALLNWFDALEPYGKLGNSYDCRWALTSRARMIRSASECLTVVGRM